MVYFLIGFDILDSNNLLKTEGTIEGVKLMLCLDTGATTSVITTRALDKLKKNGVPPEIIAEVELALDKNIEKAKSEMIKCLGKDSKIIDKVGYILIAADILNKSEHQVQEIGKKNPSHSKAFNECTKNLKMEVNNKVRGDVSKLAKEMTADSPAKDFAKKTLGANLANEILYQLQ